MVVQTAGSIEWQACLVQLGGLPALARGGRPTATQRPTRPRLETLKELASTSSCLRNKLVHLEPSVWMHGAHARIGWSGGFPEEHGIWAADCQIVLERRLWPNRRVVLARCWSRPSGGRENVLLKCSPLVATSVDATLRRSSTRPGRTMACTGAR